MTIGEVVRQIESNNRVSIIEAREKATFDYIQASLIVRGISISLGSKESYPSLQDTYGELFSDNKQEQEKVIAEKKTQLSVLRFKQFAQSYNDKFKK